MKNIKQQRGTITRATALALLSTALFTLASCSSTPQPPPPVGSAYITYKKGQAGGVLVQTVKITATVAAIDQAERTATLQGSDAKKFTVQVGPAAVNFDQIRVGDWVNATVTQKVTVYLDDKEAPSAKGAGEITQITGEVTAIDSKKCTVTLRFEDGTTETLPVRADLDLSRHKVGEHVVFRVTEMTAIWVEKAQ
jgi:Cu/Ag efflux protein CusF